MTHGNCDICGKPDSPLAKCGDHYHFACPSCSRLINHNATGEPHSAIECKSRKCSWHRDLWAHYEDEILTDPGEREIAKRQALGEKRS